MRPQTALLLLGVTLTARSAVAITEPPAQPQLRIETGGHHAPIESMSVDAQGRWLVTGSDDLTARIWDLHTGRQLRVLRLPNGVTGQDFVYATAMSPDGSLVALGGWSGWEWSHAASVYLFDRNTGRLVLRIGDLPQSVRGLSFSADGKRLAVQDVEGDYANPPFCEVRVYSVPDGKLLMNARIGDSPGGVAFSRTGWLAATSQSTVVLFHPGDLREVARVSLGHELYYPRFSPDGTRVAVSLANGRHPEVVVLAAPSLSVIKHLPAPGPVSGFPEITWSNDGRFLFADCVLNGNPSKRQGELLRRWDNAWHAVDHNVDEPYGPVYALAAADSGIIFGLYDGSWGIRSHSGKVTLRVPAGRPEFNGLVHRFAVSPDGQRVTFHYLGEDKQLLGFSVETGTISPVRDTDLKKGYRTALSKTPHVHLRVDESSPDKVLLNGHPLAIDDSYGCSERDIADDESFFVLGCYHHIFALDRSGKFLWYTANPAPTNNIVISRDKRLVVAAFGDGTIRWYRAGDGKQLLAFFASPDRKRWVAWTPSGYYAASVGGADLLGWQVNRGNNAPPDYFPASTFRRDLYRPDIVARVLSSGSEEDAVRLANAAARRQRSKLVQAFQTQPKGAAAYLPPVVTLLAPSPDAAFADSHVTVRAKIRSPSHQPVTAVRVFVDGRPWAERRHLTSVDPATNDGELLLGIDLPARDCLLSVLAETSSLAGPPVTVRLHWIGHTLVVVSHPRLFVVTLDPAGQDSGAIIGALQQQAPNAFREVVVRSLTGSGATRARLRDTLAELGPQAAHDDVIVVALLGTGEMNAHTGLMELMAPDGAITATDLAARLGPDQARILVIADACGDGLNLDGFAEELVSAENGIAVLAHSESCGHATIAGSITSAMQRRGLTFDGLIDSVRSKAQPGELIVAGRPLAMPDFSLTSR